MLEGVEEVCFGAVVGRLCAGESTAVDPVVDGWLQQRLPTVDLPSLMRSCQIRCPIGCWPFVEQLHQLSAFVAEDPRPAGIHQHRHGGPVRRGSSTVPVQLQQGVAPLPGGIQLPSSGAVVGPGDQRRNAAAESPQLMHQPGAVGPRTASSEDQQGASLLRKRCENKGWNAGAQVIAAGSLVVPLRISRPQASHQSLPLPLPALPGGDHKSRGDGHGSVAVGFSLAVSHASVRGFRSL